MFRLSKQCHLAILCLTLLTTQAACNFKDEKESATDQANVWDPSQPVTFKDIQSKILVPSCVNCHSTAAPQAGVNLETYAGTKEKLVAIKSSTVDSTRMPKGSTLSADRIAMLKAWIEAGAPE